MSTATTADERIPQALLDRVESIIKGLEAPSVGVSRHLASSEREDWHTLGTLREGQEEEEEDDEEYSPPSSIASSPCSSPRQVKEELPDDIHDESIDPEVDGSRSFPFNSELATGSHPPQSSSGRSERAFGTSKPVDDSRERSSAESLLPDLAPWEDRTAASHPSPTTTFEDLHPGDLRIPDPRRASDAFSILTRSSASTIKATASIITTASGSKEVYKARPRSLKHDRIVMVKICWLEDRFVIAVPASINLERLLQRVRKKIRMCGYKDVDQQIKLRYLDDEGDQISILTDEDLWLAFDIAARQTSDITRITLVASTTDPKRSFLQIRLLPIN